MERAKSIAKEEAVSEDSNYEDDDNFIPETPLQDDNLKVKAAVLPPEDEKDSYSEACEEDKNEGDEQYKEDEFEEDVKT